MDKFTPGPWMVEKENCHAGQVATCHGDKDGWYEVWTPNWGNGVDQEANANLIAAAPDLYSALVAMAEEFNSDGLGTEKALDMAYAALAKARGK